MLATLYYWGTKPKNPVPLRGKCLIFAGLLTFLFGVCLPVFSQEDSRPPTTPLNAGLAAHAEKVFQSAKARYKEQPTNAEAAWQFGRACYDWGDFATSKAQQEDIAKQGIAACLGVVEKDTHSAVGHYYLALNLGQLARTKKLAALKMVEQMEGEFKTVLSLDPKLDYAGADRGLGLLYMEAPGWPMSIGSKSKARQHLLKAERMFPAFPENVLNMIEADAKWGDHTAAVRELRKLDEIWAGAKKELTGENWAASWADWEQRRATFWEKVTGKTAPPPP